MCVVAIQCLITNYTFYKNSILESISYLIQIPLFMVPNNYLKIIAIILFLVSMTVSYMKKAKGETPATA